MQLEGRLQQAGEVHRRVHGQEADGCYGVCVVGVGEVHIDKIMCMEPCRHAPVAAKPKRTCGARDEFDAGQEEERGGQHAGQKDGAHGHLAPVAPRVELSCVVVCVSLCGDRIEGLAVHVQGWLAHTQTTHPSAKSYLVQVPVGEDADGAVLRQVLQDAGRHLCMCVVRMCVC